MIKLIGVLFLSVLFLGAEGQNDIYKKCTISTENVTVLKENFHFWKIKCRMSF